MSGIKGKNTKHELVLRRALHGRGFRFRLHSSKFHGQPDIFLPKYREVVFVHGCFWHRHEGCRYATTPSTRPEYWQIKFEANVARDSAVRNTFLKDGWRVAMVWECAMRKPDQVELAGERLAVWLVGCASQLDLLGADLISPHRRY